MSTSRPTDLPAGPELDLSVAKACGINYKITHGRAEFQPDGTRFYEWSPSTNIVDAFEALGVMRGKGWDYQIECSSPPGYVLCCLVHEKDAPDTDFSSRFECRGQFMAMGHAEAPAHAISIAIVWAGKGGGG